MMKKLTLMSATALLAISGVAYSGNNVKKSADDSLNSAVSNLKTSQSIRPYNSTFNPRQKEYPNHLGFNDLHIQAIRHLPIEGTKDVKRKLHNIVHHHCKAYDDGTLVCLMFHSGMKNNDKPIGFEYIIPTAIYNGLPEAEKSTGTITRSKYL